MPENPYSHEGEGKMQRAVFRPEFVRDDAAKYAPVNLLNEYFYSSKILLQALCNSVRRNKKALCGRSLLTARTRLTLSP